MTFEEKIEYLWDRQAIIDCLNRYPRGLDRHDVELTLSAFHDDAIDEHGHDVNPMPQFAYWANKLHEENFGIHLHNLTTHNCDIDGDTAYCETYVLAGLSTKDRKDVWLIGGRYLDHLTKRQGAWKISLRKTLIDWVSIGRNIADDPAMQTFGYPAGTWDKSDPSYARPFQASATRPVGADL